MESPQSTAFLDSQFPLVKREAIRAVYDTAAADSEAGNVIAALTPNKDLPESVQRRIVTANYRKGGDTHAKQLLKIAAHSDAFPSVRRAALHALQKWENTVDTDPVHGNYRPVVAKQGERTMANLSKVIGDDLKTFLAGDHSVELISLGMELATAAGVELDPKVLVAQAKNNKLSPTLRVATLNSLVETGAPQAAEVVASLLGEKNPELAATAMKHAFSLQLDGIEAKAKSAVTNRPILVAREAIAGLAKTSIESVATLWKTRSKDLRKELHLDAYLALQENGHADAATYASADPNNVFLLSETGGDPVKGEFVFRNQGACMQCHKVGSEGGIQGPDLTGLAKRLKPGEILEAVYNPGATITKGYGSTAATMKSGDVVMGRIANENKKQVTLIALDGKETVLKRDDIQTLTPPVSAMPPMAAALPPRDLRDLVAYLVAQDGKKKKTDAESHGDDEEKITK